MNTISLVMAAVGATGLFSFLLAIILGVRTLRARSDADIRQ